MAFWNWGKKADADRPLPSGSAAKAWNDASEAMAFYLDYREKYNLPFTPERWRDDFALGFRDGVGHLHFTILNDVPNLDNVLLRWKLAAVRNDEALEDAWAKVFIDSGGYTERANSGIQAAMMLESWRLKKECIKGGLEYIARHEKEYRESFPDATRFNIDHNLVMTHFVVPLVLADKVIHPYLLESRTY